ncbi:MAG: 3-phosphoshikimate 1-carboxyvinyltransferase [Ignavibacteria bacterium GWB2_35_12]|nr:MAG: 3-phosphoshikimate 1-carboxyvinyltransferase [Ignavibacteria bacterium GWB2_35_12]OGU92289.1 MAG: 3-phosphoshikimate 1-carboxyvinyltransferase [Ignavibacteria bacterium RIFOXYA2_FULL_35_10]OGV20299.1 MAG: 3-phosphoshikimate 1-carboxyvinyltransferase [Ignavibacteria bacterium RIFOXYC2_FULL_35_21]
MEKIIRNSVVNGRIDAPPSKSMTIRALAAASMCQSESVISNYSVCDDALAALDIIKALGSKIRSADEVLKIKGGKPPENKILNCRESAFCLRLFSAIASVYDIEFVLVAEKSLLKRHTGNMEEILCTLGVECKTNNDYPPIKVHGPIKGGNIKLDGSKSSQLLSGLLFSLPLAQKDSTIEVANLKSKPYIDLTLDVLSKSGIEIRNDNYELFRINGGQNYSPAKLEIEGDWSCASNFLVAGAINGEVEIGNLKLDSFQGDKVIVDLLNDVGAEVALFDNSIKVCSNELKQFEFDASDCPDLVPILAVLGCFCEGESVISNISRLAGKESSRAEIIAKELNSLGAKIRLEEDSMRIEKSSLRGGRVNSHCDHRIAMALGVAVLSSSEPVIIENAECVSKSYPDFWEDFEKVKQIK